MAVPFQPKFALGYATVAGFGSARRCDLPTPMRRTIVQSCGLTGILESVAK